MENRKINISPKHQNPEHKNSLTTKTGYDEDKGQEETEMWKWEQETCQLTQRQTTDPAKTPQIPIIKAALIKMRIAASFLYGRFYSCQIIYLIKKNNLELGVCMCIQALAYPNVTNCSFKHSCFLNLLLLLRHTNQRQWKAFEYSLG